MQAPRSWRPVAVILGAFTVTALTAATGFGQLQLESAVQMLKNFRMHQAKIGVLTTGAAQPGKEDQAAIDAAADWYTLRLAAGKFTTAEADLFHSQVATFFRNTSDYGAKNGPFVRRLSPAVVDRLQRVFAEDFEKGTVDTRLMIINTAATLPHVAKLRDETIGEMLVELLKDQGKADGGALRGPEVVRMYAARGLKEFMPLRGISEGDYPLKKKEIDLKARESGYVNSLVQLIERPHSAKLPTVEQDAIRFVRREAIESLAAATVPAEVAVFSPKDKPPLEGPVAPTLWKVLAGKNGGLSPAPALPERLEAAIGVATLRYKIQKSTERYECPDYDPAPGLYLVANFGLDFANAYSQDLGNIAAKQPARFPWKHQAKRLEAALATMKENAKTTPNADKAAQIENAVKTDILAMIQKGQPINGQQFNAYRTFVNQLKPKAPQVLVFRNIKCVPVTIDAGAAAAGAGAEK